MTKAIVRDLEKCSKEPYDLIIVGGGIYGVMLSFEAVRRKLRPLVLEKNDFIGATSLNHLRTVHGGIRYLQSLDFHRFLESVGERKWFLEYLPRFVSPVPCIMPLYGKGMYRNSILWAGLLMNDILSLNRNKSVSKDRHLPRGKIISPQQTREIFPAVDDRGLTGSALWYDANIEEYQRLMIELLKTAVSCGATALNYVQTVKMKTDNGHAAGVLAVDRETGTGYEFDAPVVINAAGPWCRDTAQQFDRDHARLFKKRMLLWNVLFDHEALSDHALGLSPVKGGGHTYFFQPWKNRLLVGTGEVVVDKSENETVVPAHEMEKFIKDIDTMVPGLNLTGSDIQRVYSGILPASENNSLANREVIVDHSKEGGPKGLFSISGVKFTTSRLVADKTLDRVFPGAKKMPHKQILETMGDSGLSFDYDWEPGDEADLGPLKEIVQNEAVVHLSDLILRRTSLGDHPERALKILPGLKSLFDWDDGKWEKEVKELKDDLSVIS
jgi:glycerol-3-phosphate dehydrogenase